MTFRTELKKKLNELAYPVEISKWYANGRGIRCLGREVISKKGIKIERERVDEYRPCLHIDKWNEYINVYTNGYVSSEDIKKIVNEVFENYKLPYGIISLEVKVYSGEKYCNASRILELKKTKDYRLNEAENTRIARC